MLSRPKRSCTASTLKKINQIHEWENLKENSEAFKSMACELDRDLANENLADEVENTENEPSDCEPDEAETSSENNESYESSFVSSDSDVDDEDTEWTPRMCVTQEPEIEAVPCPVEQTHENHVADSLDGVLQPVCFDAMLDEQVLSYMTFPDEDTDTLFLSEELDPG